MTVKEMQERAKALNAEAADLDKKIAETEDEAEQRVYGKQRDEKLAKVDELIGKATAMAEAEARAEKIATMADDTPAGKKSELEGVEVPDSEHNQLAGKKQLDDASRSLLFCAVGDEEQLLSKMPVGVAEEVFYEDREAPYRMPSYMVDYMIYGKKAFGGLKGKTEYTMLTSDASGSQSGGGSIVPDEFVNELYKLPMFEAQLMPRCYVKRAVGKNALFPRLSGQSSERYGVSVTVGTEGSAITESDPVVNQLSIGTEQISAIAYASLKEMRVNKVGMQAEIANLFRGAWTYKIDNLILEGGETNFVGINTNTALTAGVNRQTRETASQVSYVDLVNLQFAGNTGSRGRSLYIISDGSTSALKYIMSLDDTGGHPVLLGEGSSWAEGMAGRLVGHEFVPTEANTSAVGSRGDVIFGDLSAYGICIDQDFSFAKSEDYKFNQALVTFRVLSYVGGKCLGEDAFTVLCDPSGVSSSSSSSS